MTVPSLILRLIKNAPLTPSEMDGNLTTLRDFCNQLSLLISASLETDGTLKDGAVGSADVVGDRVISRAALDSKALPFFLDTGGVNNFVIAPTPAVNYEDEQIFFIRANNTNTGACTLLLTGATPAGVKPLRKRGGIELDAGDINKNQVFCCAYYGGAFEVIATSSGVGGGGGGSSGSGFSGFSVYEPADVDMPVAPAYPYAFGVFQHGLQAAPSVEVSLVCSTSELGFASGDAIPLSEVHDVTGKENFIVQSNSINLTVTMALAPYVRDTATGTLTAITPANWKVRVRARVITSASAPQFPALNYLAKYPRGVWANGNDLFYVQYNNNVALTARIDLATGNASLVPAAASSPNYNALHVAPFRLSNGLDMFVFTANTGIYRQPMLTPFQPVRLGNAQNSVDFNRRPIHIRDTSGSIDQVIAAGWHRGEALTSIRAYANVAFGGVGAGVVLTGGADTPMSLMSASILNASGVAGNNEFIALNQGTDTFELFQYNKFKKRLYILTESNKLLHIFELVGTSGYVDPSSILEWWQDNGRLSKLQYKKTLAVAGTGDYVADTSNEHYFIDVDMSTGDERAICFGRSGNGGYAGSITRVPWRE